MHVIDGREMTMGKRSSHVLSLSPVQRIACGAELNNKLRETEWLNRVNGSTEVQHKLTQKAKAYAKFKPLSKPKAEEPIERVEPVVRHVTSRLRFSGRDKLKVKGFGPWG